MSIPKISLNGVTKSFGTKRVLRGIDLDVARGESVVVIGGSGTGKSVLLKCILGLIRPDAGSIRIDNEETVDLNERGHSRVMRKFGMLFQGGALFDSLRVWENVAFGPIQSDGMAPAQAREIAIAKLGSVGLAQGRATSPSRSWARWASGPKSETSTPPNFQAACRSASALPAPSRRTPRSSSSTSRPPASTRSWPT